MKLLNNFDRYVQNERFYGGSDCIKVGISIDGVNYIVKYQGRPESNSPVSEYIGCMIYKSLGIPVQEVHLGLRNSKVVVACKDFLEDDEQFVPYRNIKATFEPSFTDPQGDISNGTGSVLPEIIRTFKEHPFMIRYPYAEVLFWQMFVVDALIGNPDRNNENWGFIRDSSGQSRLAPVFDCGNCLNNKMSDRQIEAAMQNDEQIIEIALKRPCIFERSPGKRISAYSYITSMSNDMCNKAILDIVPRIDMIMIFEIVNSVPFLSEIRKKFYNILMEIRYKDVLLWTYQQLADQR